MRRLVFNPKTLAEPVGHFDRAVRIGNILYISGTSALTHVSGSFQDRKLAPTIEEQTRLTFDNIRKVMDAAGGKMSDIFKLTVFLVRPEDFNVVDAITKEYLPDRGFINSAFRTDLLNPDMLIEIEATALLE
ncbi:MAG: RidA family protein [Betaproteobacteria bacterium]|nr:RidA family protein [Betaproteobacteria bacterium]